MLFLSTLSLRRATAGRMCFNALMWYFYPRSPCGERHPVFPVLKVLLLFLSTLSLRRATAILQQATLQNLDFYPRSPCGERQGYMLQFIWINVISIHALLAESDFANFEGFSWWVISIHALLAESDLMMLSMVAILILFLSTLSLRRATTPARMSSRLLLISIHALLAESDVNKIPNQCKIDEFLSTLSLRRATIFEHTIVEHFGFLSTLSLRRATIPLTGI